MTDCTGEISAIQADEWPGFVRMGVRIPSGSISVRMDDSADGPVVVFCHSILTSSAIWARQARLLAGRGYRVLCIDHRGHGHSSAPDSPYCISDLVSDVLAVLDQQAIYRAHFVGVSLGGMVGLALASSHPQRLHSLCVAASLADVTPEVRAAWDERIATAEQHGTVEPLALPTATRWFGEPFLAAHPDITQALVQCIRGTSLQGFVGCARAVQGLNILVGLNAITAITTLIVGTRDPLLESMRDLMSLIRHSTLHIIADAGHLPQIDQPDAFDDLLLAHLGRPVDR